MSFEGKVVLVTGASRVLAGLLQNRLWHVAPK